MKKKILLLNPPAKKRFIRELYCSKLASGAYHWEPADLIVMTSVLKEKFDLTVIDAIIENLTAEETIGRILSEKFSAIISLIGSASLENDLKFLELLKKKTKAKILVSGDITTSESDKLLMRSPFIDACLSEFATPLLVDFLNDRYEGKVIPETPAKPGVWKIPLPAHELFPLKKYHLPFFDDEGVATIVFSLGCPFKCSFCISGTLPLRMRSVDSVVAEIKYLLSLSIRQFFFRDPLFEADIKRSKDFCQAIIDQKLDCRWSCNSRVDTIMKDKDLLPLMGKSGCKMILFGVESGDNKVLESVNKKTTVKMITRAFKACKKNKIGSSGYFIIGLPEDNKSTIRKTIDFAKKLSPDFAVFSIPSPDYRTSLRKHFIDEGKIKNEIREFDRGGGKREAISTEYLTAEEIIKWQKRAFQEFYFRPAYIFPHLSSFLRPKRIGLVFRELFFLLKNYF